MKFNFFHVYTLLFFLALVRSDAVTPQVYWNSVLPETPMPNAIKDLLYTKEWDDGIEKVTMNTASTYLKLNDQPEQSYSYGASRDEAKDPSQSNPFFLYGASNDVGKDQQQSKPVIRHDASSDEAKDHSQDNPFFLYGVSNDVGKDQQQSKPVIRHGAFKDEAKDHSQDNPFFLYGASNDVGKDQQQSNPVIRHGASSDEAKDHSQDNPFFLYGASNDVGKDQQQSKPLIRHDAFSDEAKDHSQDNPFFLYGASNDVGKDQQQSNPVIRHGAFRDEAKDHSQDNPFFLYGASNDVGKDQQQSIPLIRHGASSDEEKDPSQSNPFFLYGASNDVGKDHPQSVPLIRHDASSDMAKDHTPKEEGKVNLFAQLFFLENDLHQGKEMKLQLNIHKKKTTLLPKYIADSLPFSSKDLPKIYNMFSIEPNSMEAQTMKETIHACDQYKAIEGEVKVCVTSLESMIDFATSKLGKKVKALSEENAKDSTTTQMYKIELVKKLVAKKFVVCHRQMYPYAVFYCHTLNGTESYVVSLEGENGTKVKSLALCHTDTSKFSPKYLGFQLLKLTPGTASVCHFLLEDAVLWVPY